MKNTIGLIFLFAVINVSYSASLRELDFLKSLYPREDIPKLVLTAMVNRRIDQVKTLYERKLILEDGKTFYNYTEQSLHLFAESIDSSDIPKSKLFELYSDIVQIINEVNKLMGIESADYLTVNSDTIFSKINLLAMIDAYIGDIEMVHKCEVYMGRADRLDMTIVERIKSLSNELQNYIYPNDHNRFYESINLSKKIVDQFLWQFEFLLIKFTTAFTHHKG
ncbi:uncharacterized protein LOC107370505 isoform X6 [Tetranychus urticae]|uniref:uncharacterized protein LOC107370505 isoform X6 n=1 Tax=Tetranychus urticae TaxID=32264 RepID=UPI00077C01DD|nr:uncharacterized protein LOC107370505 isoform X6 [Tetranychus urticae]